MLKVIIYLGYVILLLIINRILINKRKFFLPIIIVSCSLIVMLISVVQIIYKQKQDTTPEVQTIEASTNMKGEVEIEGNNPIVVTNSYIQVETEKSLFTIDLLWDFLAMNVPTILCVLDILIMKKRNANT